MVKRTFLLLLLALMVITGHAQHFEWVKAYGDSQEGSFIKGMVSDDDGNLYILGQITPNAIWEGERVIPTVLPGLRPSELSTLIAKISPSGEMVWKKYIYATNNQNQLPLDIKKVGDSTFACLIEISLPSSDNYTYYLDTVLPTWSDYPTPGWGVEYKKRTAFILFDFDGNVIEQHFLFLSYTDSIGNDFVEFYDNPPSPWICNQILFRPSFDVDLEGNIYLCREAVDVIRPNISTQTGSLKSLKIWCDQRVAGEIAIPDGTKYWFPQILKFSPHFDTLLASRYVVQKCDNDSANYASILSDIKVDSSGNVYFMMSKMLYGVPTNTTLVLDSIQNISVIFSEKTDPMSYLVQFDSDLNINWKITLDDSLIQNTREGSMTFFTDFTFDNDSNLLFLSVKSVRCNNLDTVGYCSILKYLDTPLALKTSGHFLISFNLTETPPTLHSYGNVPSIYSSDGTSPSKGTICCKNNRVFLQTANQGGVRFPNNTIRFEGINDKGLGLSIFDYQCNIITGIDYAAISPNNFPSTIILHDSLLYLSSRLVSSATFGDAHLSNEFGSRLACIAKYIDPAFMTLYHSPTTPSAVGESLSDSIHIYPNPAHDILLISNVGEPTREMSIISVLGSRKQVSPHNSAIPIGDLMPGTYILEIITENNKYYHKFTKQ